MLPSCTVHVFREWFIWQQSNCDNIQCARGKTVTESWQNIPLVLLCQVHYHTVCERGSVLENSVVVLINNKLTHLLSCYTGLNLTTTGRRFFLLGPVEQWNTMWHSPSLQPRVSTSTLHLSLHKADAHSHPQSVRFIVLDPFIILRRLSTAG